MKWTRDAYIELMTFGDVPRQMFVELFGPLVGLEDEWLKQGATHEELTLTGFDFDYVHQVDCGGNFNVLSGIKPSIIEDTDTYTISIDEFGRKTKLIKNSATIPLPLNHPVTDMDSWLKIKHWFTFSEDRINWKQVEKAKHEQKHGALITAGIQGGFDLPRQLMGEEAICFCYYDQKELMQDMMDTLMDTTIKVLDRISDHLVIDNLCAHEDMAGKSGPLVGPGIVHEFIKPYYAKAWDVVSSKGTRLFSLDSDGNMNAIIDPLLDAGVNILYPIEPAAGMDMVELRSKYGNRLAFKGGIDKFVLFKNKHAIRQELEYKLQPCMQKGGTVFGIDHRIPNGVPLESYRYYVKTAKEILNIPDKKNGRGWARMAF
ncbi:hypothetical protein HZI73_06585 [Vallitalea pronyensis]|uniref:Uroporphyrinogen decarboxylase (URO-D) domain-containing protein n=1 Tax=Vallitalea pronyensis TaxID=1348613 RepID=A0A8J8SG40_9FIRM|nr:uroporphyrinogen decarboxylase family protein [Vallitalea pronyensis]QUI21987.1 hypothetical protein HZI73_06585 [Vallitalea pronyensis]